MEANSADYGVNGRLIVDIMSAFRPLAGLGELDARKHLD